MDRVEGAAEETDLHQKRKRPFGGSFKGKVEVRMATEPLPVSGVRTRARLKAET